MSKKVKYSRVGKWDNKKGADVLPPFYFYFQIKDKKKHSEYPIFWRDILRYFELFNFA